MQHFNRLLIYFMCTFICSAPTIPAYKFLGIMPTVHRSHFIFGSALMKALAEKGHEVYVISAFPQQTPIANYHDVPFTYYENPKEGKTEIDWVEIVLRSTDVKNLLKSKHKFDAVICEVFYAEALFGISEHFGSPLIGLSPHGNLAWNTEMVGSPSPSSYVPSLVTKFNDHMSLIDRTINLVSATAESLFMNFNKLPPQAKAYKKHFPLLKKDFYEVRKNIAVLLINSNDGVDYPRPYVPAQIAVGGMHIKQQPQPLPDTVAQFIKDARHGVVYFALGEYADCKTLRATTCLDILRTFRRLKQRVLWKLDDPTYIGMHHNVLVRSWFPQQDILAHENVKVFITKGGTLSMSETMYHAKPVVGIPLVGDHHMNMAKAKHAGIGITLDYKTLTAQDIVKAVHHVISNKKYTQRAKEMSALYRDQPMLPLDLAVYWVEHVARRKGAKHLHCAALDLSIFAYYHLDALLFTLVAIQFIILPLHILRLEYFI